MLYYWTIATEYASAIPTELALLSLSMDIQSGFSACPIAAVLSDVAYPEGRYIHITGSPVSRNSSLIGLSRILRAATLAARSATYI